MSTAIVLTRPLGAGSNPIGLTTTVINGQPMLTLVDITRANKNLSVAEQTLVFAENNLTDRDWIRIGTTVDADSGYVTDFDGTVTSITAHCEDTGTNAKQIHLYIDDTDMGSLGTLAGGENATIGDQTLDVDFLQGQKLRLRAENPSGPIQDTVIKLTVKWREV